MIILCVLLITNNNINNTRNILYIVPDILLPLGEHLEMFAKWYYNIGYFEEDVLFTYDTLQRRSHFYEDVADSIHMLPLMAIGVVQPPLWHFPNSRQNALGVV